MRRTTSWYGWTIAVAGAYLFVTPWIFGFTPDTEAAWNAWISGGLVTLLAVIALATRELVAADWGLGLLGLWTFVAPWALEFSDLPEAAWNAWIVGVVVGMLAALRLYDFYQGSGIEYGQREDRYPRAA